MQDKHAHLVLLDEWPCPGSHYLHTKKFLESFTSHGYSYSEIRNYEDIAKIKKNDIVYLSNHGFLNSVIPYDLFSMFSATGANFILWFWHEHLSLAAELFGQNFILTGEHFYLKPSLHNHVKIWEIQNRTSQYVPLTFSSNVLPADIGTHSRSDEYLAHFIGNGYKPTLNKKLSRRFRKIKIVNTPPFIPELERKRIFLSSKVALGWHSDDNIKNNVVVERVFEGLAFGNVVLSDSSVAREVTDGIVEFADTYEETKEFLLRIKKDDAFRALKVEQGLSWAKSNGTYWHVAKRFIDHFAS